MRRIDVAPFETASFFTRNRRLFNITLDEFFMLPTRLLPLLIAGLLFLGIQSIQAQSTVQSFSKAELIQEISRMDSLLFEVGFNKCRLNVWKPIISRDLEFYDDRSGLNTSLQTEVNSFKDKCSKSFSVTRQPVNMNIYPLKKFGAVQTGVHRFYVDGKPAEQARFTHIWKFEDNQWQITRIISYDHQAIE